MTWLNILKHHRWKLGLLVLAANIGVLLNLAFGTPKAFHEWQWLDIIGEGGTALFVLLWLVLVLKSRPTGRVTNYLSIGLCCIFFSWWMDVLDEFIRLPKHLGWNHWLESGPMPVGMVLLTIGLYHWHREQQAINQQMEKRERIFREHRLFDKLTPLGGADYLKRQVSDCMAQSLEQQQPLSLLALDIDDFASLNQHYGHAEGDAVLQALSQLLLLNLRRHDLLCRLARGPLCGAAAKHRRKPRPACWLWSCNRPCRALRTKPASMASGSICRQARRWSWPSRSPR